MAIKRGKIVSGPVSFRSRSQVTAFMIIGMVILSVFGFMYYASVSTQPADVRRQIDTAEEKIRETGMLRQYVTLCLKESLETGLMAAGTQGGMIVLEDPDDYAEFEGSRVAYGIKESEFDGLMPGPSAYPCINNLGTISYPCKPSPYNQLLKPKKMYPFGSKSIAPLCDLSGPNAAYIGIVPYPCPTGTYGIGSIQEQITDYVKKGIGECVNLTPIEEIAGVTITNSTAQITIIFGEDEVTAIASYPLNMSIDGYSIVRLFDFEVSTPVRIKKMFGLVNYLVNNEIYDIEFVPEEDYKEYRYFGKELMPAMEVSRKYAEGISIIEVNDSASLIMGKPYYFRFAIQNRIPALDLIEDITAKEGEQITLYPIAYDPDDADTITYSVSGWKEELWEDCSNSNFPDACFSIDTEEGDSGNHEIKVHACDAAGECDWQPVEITIIS